MQQNIYLYLQVHGVVLNLGDNFIFYTCCHLLKSQKNINKIASPLS